MFLVMKPAALLLTLWPLLLAQPGRFATPACSGDGLDLADRTFFVICHSSVLKVPLWTGHELKPDQLSGGAARLRHFRQDAALAGPVACDNDYRGSGFSRGHMVPAEDLAWSYASLRATFVLSNAVPQRQSVNAGGWRKLEAAVRQIAAHADAVYVFTGPIFASATTEFIGEGHVAVPSHTFKVALAIEGDRKVMYAAILPNGGTGVESLALFMTTVEEVERQTGLDFFSASDDEQERRLESTRTPLPAVTGLTRGDLAKSRQLSVGLGRAAQLAQGL